jgi:hypothetical protein
VNSRSGVVYGYIVAKTKNSAFIVPLKDALDEIRKQLRASEVNLPSPFDRLTDLAVAFSQNGNSERGQSFAKQALEDDALNKSLQKEMANVIREYIGQKRSDQEVLVKLIQRVGGDLRKGLQNPDIWECGREGEFGDDKNAIAQLAYLGTAVKLKVSAQVESEIIQKSKENMDPSNKREPGEKGKKAVQVILFNSHNSIWI